jgi:hypothetical protein
MDLAVSHQADEFTARFGGEQKQINAVISKIMPAKAKGNG